MIYVDDSYILKASQICGASDQLQKISGAVPKYPSNMPWSEDFLRVHWNRCVVTCGVGDWMLGV
jgi:hypothetical protein